MTDDPPAPPPEDTSPESGWDERGDDQTPPVEPVPPSTPPVEDTKVPSDWLEEGDDQ